ncbi:MAG: Crp/Fnr family transcriptional regulator [Bacteroidales bacterium]|nr:Crp/Fnr family transcriptional regulator [Bacteroidales bacterium]
MNKIADLQTFLKNTHFFQHLNAEEIALIPLEENLEIYKRNKIIYNENNRINGFYIVYKGVVKIYKTGVDGKDQIIRFAKPGDIMGFRSTITGELACTSTKVIEEATIMYIHGDLVKSFVKSNGEFAMDLLQIACMELREANDYITDIAQKTVRERLAEVLIHLKSTFNLSDDNYLNISLTREELASIVGTATESVIRLLSDFKNDGLIEIQGRKIKLINEQKLYRIANLDY